MQTLQVTSDNVAVKLEEIPQYRRDALARSTLHAVERFFSLPGVREDYEKWLEDYERKKAV